MDSLDVVESVGRTPRNRSPTMSACFLLFIGALLSVPAVLVSRTEREEGFTRELLRERREGVEMGWNMVRKEEQAEHSWVTAL